MALWWQVLGSQIHLPSGETTDVVDLPFLSTTTHDVGDLSFARCEYGMVPLGTGVANCLGDDWSEVLDTRSLSR